GNSLFAQGNYDVSLAIDPNNPNVVYIGGTRDGNPFAEIRVDTTGVSDPKAVVAFDNRDPDGGLLQSSTTGPASPGFAGLRLVSPVTGRLITQPTINAVRDPFQPFLQNSTLVAVGVGNFNNEGTDAVWGAFDQQYDPDTFTLVDPGLEESTD